jgi:hypothetical protein
MGRPINAAGASRRAPLSDCTQYQKRISGIPDSIAAGIRRSMLRYGSHVEATQDAALALRGCYSIRLRHWGCSGLLVDPLKKLGPPLSSVRSLALVLIPAIPEIGLPLFQVPAGKIAALAISRVCSLQRTAFPNFMN